MRSADRSAGSPRPPVHGARLAQRIDLDDIGRDRALHRASHAGPRQENRQGEPAERHQPPVARLDAGRADAFVPELPARWYGVSGSGVSP